MVIKDHFEY